MATPRLSALRNVGEGERLEGRDAANRYPALAFHVPVRDTLPGVAFSRDERLTAEEYIRHYLPFVDTRRFQLIDPYVDPTVRRIYVERDGGGEAEGRFTRTGAFAKRLQHTSTWCFDNSGNEQTDPFYDIPWYRDRDERWAADELARVLRELIAVEPIAGMVPPIYPTRYHSWRDVPLELFATYNNIRFMTIPRRWGRDLETEHRVRITRHLHIAGHNVEVWCMPSESRSLVFVVIPETERGYYAMNSMLLVPTPNIFVYFSGLLLEINQDRHEFVRGQIFNVAKFTQLSHDMHALGRAEHYYNAFGRFVVTAIYGCAYGYHDSAAFCGWRRFSGALVPLTREVVEFVNLHGVDRLLRDTGLPMDLARMAFERTQELAWPTIKANGQWSGDVFLRYDPTFGDIDDMPRRNGVDKYFNGKLNGSRVIFHRVEHVNELRGPDWYRHEAIREWGAASVVNTFRYLHDKFNSYLDDREEEEARFAEDRRDYPFPPDWYEKRPIGVGVLTREVGEWCVTAEEVGDEQPDDLALIRRRVPEDPPPPPLVDDAAVRAEVLDATLVRFRAALVNSGVLPDDVEDPVAYAAERLVSWDTLVANYTTTLQLVNDSRQRYNESRAQLTTSVAALAERTRERDNLTTERDDLVAGRDALVADRDAANLRRDVAYRDRGNAVNAREEMARERDAVTEERNRLRTQVAQLRAEVAAEGRLRAAAEEARDAARRNEERSRRRGARTVDALVARGGALRAQLDEITESVRDLHEELGDDLLRQVADTAANNSPPQIPPGG